MRISLFFSSVLLVSTALSVLSRFSDSYWAFNAGLTDASTIKALNALRDKVENFDKSSTTSKDEHYLLAGLIMDIDVKIVSISTVVLTTDHPQGSPGLITVVKTFSAVEASSVVPPFLSPSTSNAAPLLQVTTDEAIETSTRVQPLECQCRCPRNEAIYRNPPETYLWVGVLLVALAITSSISAYFIHQTLRKRYQRKRNAANLFFEKAGSVEMVRFDVNDDANFN